MKTIFDVALNAPDGVGGTMRKTIEDLPFTPVIGMELEDAAWSGTRKIVRVVFSIDKLHCYVVIERYPLASEEEYEQHKLCFKASGWEIPGSQT